MSKRKIFKIFKRILTILILALVVGMIFYLFPMMKDLGTLEGQAKFKEESQGLKGLFTLIGFQLAQIFLIVLPGEPLEILAGMYYGKVFGTLFIMISNCIISTIIFLLVRKFGKKFIYEFFPKEKIEKVENSKLFQNPKEVEIILFALFLLPGTPKDLLVYISGLLPINPIKFILISTFARFPSIINSTVAGEAFAIGNWKQGIMLYVLIFLIVGILLLAMNKFNLRKAQKGEKSNVK